MAGIFISYAAEDRERVRTLAEAIESAGFTVWWDRRIEPGQSFDREIERELGAALCVVVVWSYASVDSDWVREEADDGLKRGILVPVQIDDCAIPLGFRRKQAAQLAGWPKQKHDLAPLIERINSVSGAPPGGTIAPKRLVQRTTFIVASTVVIIGVAVAVIFRASIMTMLVISIPSVFFGDPVPQEIGITTTADGTRIAYATSGDGPPIVYVLGWMSHLQDGFNSPVYDNDGLVAMSGRRNTFIRYDGRGFGLSDRDVKDLSIRARVNDLRAVVDDLGLERFGILAASSGGAPAIVFSAEHPERVTSLVVAGFGVADSGGHETSESREASARMLDLFEVAWEQPEVSDMFASFVLSPTGNEVEKRVLGELLRQCCGGPNVADYFRILGSFNVREYATQVQVPTLVINARDDQASLLEDWRGVNDLRL